jgi:hypothetical protein
MVVVLGQALGEQVDVDRHLVREVPLRAACPPDPHSPAQEQDERAGAAAHRIVVVGQPLGG